MKTMNIILPSISAVLDKGWKYQVQWCEDNKACFFRCIQKRTAERQAEKLAKKGYNTIVINLHDALQI